VEGGAGRTVSDPQVLYLAILLKPLNLPGLARKI